MADENTGPAFEWRTREFFLNHDRVRPQVLPLKDGRVLVYGGTEAGYFGGQQWQTRDVPQIELLDFSDPQFAITTLKVGKDGTLPGVVGLRWSAEKEKWEEVTKLPYSTELPYNSRLWKKVEALGKLKRISPTLTLLPNRHILVTAGYEVWGSMDGEESNHRVGPAEVIDVEKKRVFDGGTPWADFHSGVAVLPDSSVIIAGGNGNSGSGSRTVIIGTPSDWYREEFLTRQC